MDQGGSSSSNSNNRTYPSHQHAINYSTPFIHDHDPRTSIRLSRDFPIPPPTTHSRSTTTKSSRNEITLPLTTIDEPRSKIPTHPVHLDINVSVDEYTSLVAQLRHTIDPFHERHHSHRPTRHHHQIPAPIPQAPHRAQDSPPRRSSASSQQRWVSAGGTAPLAERQRISSPTGWNEGVLEQGRSMHKQDVERGMDLWLQFRERATSLESRDDDGRDFGDEMPPRGADKGWARRLFQRRKD